MCKLKCKNVLQIFENSFAKIVCVPVKKCTTRFLVQKFPSQKRSCDLDIFGILGNKKFYFFKKNKRMNIKRIMNTNKSALLWHYVFCHKKKHYIFAINKRGGWYYLLTTMVRIIFPWEKVKKSFFFLPSFSRIFCRYTLLSAMYLLHYPGSS